MDANVIQKSYLITFAIIIFSFLMLCANPAFSRGGHGGEGHRGGGHHGGYHHGGYHHGGYHRGYRHGGYGYRGGWGGWGGGYRGGYYYTNSCIWVPAHYNRYGNFIPGHRAC